MVDIEADKTIEEMAVLCVVEESRLAIGDSNAASIMHFKYYSNAETDSMQLCGSTTSEHILSSVSVPCTTLLHGLGVSYNMELDVARGEYKLDFFIILLYFCYANAERS